MSLLFRSDTRSDGLDHARRHLELILAIADSVPLGDPVKSGVGGPHFTLLILEHKEPHRPVEASVGIGRDELRSSGGLPKISNTDGWSIMPASAASFD